MIGDPEKSERCLKLSLTVVRERFWDSLKVR
jgi:hypothetical protein